MPYLNRNNRNTGFTLIELLVVIAIIGLLSTLAIITLNSAREKAREVKRKANIKQISSACQLYYDDYLHYPYGPGATLMTLHKLTVMLILTI